MHQEIQAGRSTRTQSWMHSAADKTLYRGGRRGNVWDNWLVGLALLATPLAGSDAQSAPAPRGNLGLATGFTVDTQRVSLSDARGLALGANPELRATHLDTAIARGQMRQARLLQFNPTADVTAAGGGKGAEPSVAQEIEVFNQRGARITSAGAALERARALVRDATRRAIGDTDRAFYQLAAAIRRAELAEEIHSLSRRLEDVTSRQLRAGEISRLDYNLALVELGRSRSRMLAAQREHNLAARELARLTGMSQKKVIMPVVDTSTSAINGVPEKLLIDSANASSLPALSALVDSLTTVSILRRPDVAERAAAERQALAEASLTRREALPNVVLRVSSERERGSARSVRPGVGLTLPLFNRNQGEAESQVAMAIQASLERAGVVSRIRAEVAGAVSSYASAIGEVQVLELTVLAPARQNRQLLETAYREGKVGLPVLLLIRNQVVDAELDYWSAWLAAHQARATLDEVTGDNLALIQDRDGGPQ